MRSVTKGEDYCAVVRKNIPRKSRLKSLHPFAQPVQHKDKQKAPFFGANMCV